jgi:serine protease AprX
MKTTTNVFITFAILGAAALYLQQADLDSVPQADANDIRITLSTPSADQASSFAHTAEAAGDHHDLVYGETVVAVPADSTGRAVTSRVSREEQQDREQKLQVAQAKMSGPVAALAMAGGPGLADVIVSYDDHPELFEADRVKALGGEVIRHYEVLKLLAIRIPAESLVELAIEDDVARLSLDDTVVTSSTAAHVAAKVPAYPSGNLNYDGYDQTVAVLDTGVAYHDDLPSNVRQYSFLDGEFPRPSIEYDGDDIEIEKYNSDSRVDGYGHGTHVAGIITGNGGSSSGNYIGAADGSSVLSLQVLDENGEGQLSDVLAALEWLLKYGDAFEVSVANLSLGKPITESNTTDPLVAAVEAVWDSGIVVVVAAGNFGREGYFSITSPGNSRKVITVGSLTDNGTGSNYGDDYASTYSSLGPTAEDHVVKPDLLAPGNRLVAASAEKSTLADLLPGNVVACTISDDCKKRSYLELSGTSMAAAMVSAAAARMLDKDDDLSPATIKARLMRSARKIGESPVVVGAGLLDVEAAMNETGVVSGQALSPLVSYEANSGGTLIQDTAQLWGSKIWGAGYLWTDGITANGYLWTDGSRLSTSSDISSSGYLWTDGGLWANGYLWTDGGVAAFGYLWTDGGVNANGYLWTDGGGFDANGFLWTDGGLNALALYDLWGSNPSLNDDEHTSD